MNPQKSMLISHGSASNAPGDVTSGIHHDPPFGVAAEPQERTTKKAIIPGYPIGTILQINGKSFEVVDQLHQEPAVRTRSEIAAGEYVGAIKVKDWKEAAAIQPAIRARFGNIETWTYEFAGQPQVGFVAKSPEAFTCINYFALGFLAGRGSL